MTLWINGDWVTGQGERRVKTNPVNGEVLWQGSDADATQVAEGVRRVQRFRPGPGCLSPRGRPSWKNLPPCWRFIKRS